MLAPRNGVIRIASLCIVCIALAEPVHSPCGCSVAQTNFSQYPGFAAYFAAHPPRDTLPTAAEQALLRKYRPRHLLAPNHPGLICFYADYIGQGDWSTATATSFDARHAQTAQR